MSEISLLRKWFFNLLILGTAARIATAATTTVVFSDPADPYYSIAQEIAREENAPLATSLEEALVTKSDFLLLAVPFYTGGYSFLYLPPFFKSF